MKENSSFPWGTAKVLTEGENYRVKRISLKPESRQSYQSHDHRAEAWLMVSGEGKITIDDVESRVTQAAVVMISIGTKHRIENTSKVDPLVFVETQFGSYIGEDDIIRYEDDYGRHLDNWADCDADLL
jgi:mannose-6-phosphate isomerase-like protein (cupin superfamily)